MRFSIHAMIDLFVAMAHHCITKWRNNESCYLNKKKKNSISIGANTKLRIYLSYMFCRRPSWNDGILKLWCWRVAFGKLVFDDRIFIAIMSRIHKPANLYKFSIYMWSTMQCLNLTHCMYLETAMEQLSDFILCDCLIPFVEYSSPNPLLSQ